MRIIPVIDLLGGAVVRGIAGRRREYLPIESRLAAGSEPGAIAAAFVNHFGATTCYVADLDAIERGEFQVAAWKAIADAGLRLWLDAGIGTSQRAAQVTKACRRSEIDADMVVGLESLASAEELPRIASAIGTRRVIFSLDLKAGVPLAADHGLGAQSPPNLAEMAIAAGIQRMIILDLADVGTGGGTRTLDLCREIHAEHCHVELIAGGGVRHLDDLQRIADAGCNAALVASALHDGRLTKADWDAALTF